MTAAPTPSPRWTLTRANVASAIRHTILPLIAGCAVAALSTMQTGQLSWEVARTAATTAGIAGLIRLLQQWATTQGTP